MISRICCRSTAPSCLPARVSAISHQRLLLWSLNMDISFSINASLLSRLWSALSPMWLALLSIRNLMQVTISGCKSGIASRREQALSNAVHFKFSVGVISWYQWRLAAAFEYMENCTWRNAHDKKTARRQGTEGRTPCYETPKSNCYRGKHYLEILNKYQPLSSRSWAWGCRLDLELLPRRKDS